MRKYPEAACAVGEILLPRPGVDLQKWAVVACDQYTAQPGYWRAADDLVGEAPSTLRLIYPEVYLGKEAPEGRIATIRGAMDRYLAEGVLVPHQGLVYLERETSTGTRRGLVMCLDLEAYDYRKGSTSLIRATEGTIVERLPPRVRIRDGAALELPHIMVLVDDREDRVVGGVAARKADLAPVYDVDLMADSGHLAGWRVDDPALEQATMAAIAALGEPEAFRRRYDLAGDHPVLLYAVGDGNHSLATAKAIWEQVKERAGGLAPVAGDPARYALVEIVNIHDPSLEFEPIHRVFFEVRADLRAFLQARLGDRVSFHPAAGLEALTAAVDAAPAGVQRFGLLEAGKLEVVEVADPPANIAVGTLQPVLDAFMKEGGAGEIDYVHGTDVVHEVGTQAGNLGIYLPGMEKSDLFRSVILDGALPRKTFSMGEAPDKRFYMECRRIRPTT